MLNYIYSYMPTATMYSGDSFFTGLILAVVLALTIGLVLVSQSRTKLKASKAKEYISTKLELTESSDAYSHTTTSKTRVKS